MPEDPTRETQESRPDGGEPESIPFLIERAQNGDQVALDRLFQRCYPVIRRLAHGRLPDQVRGEKDTSDLVQITFLRALRGLKGFQSRWEDAWLVYLRRILFNHLRDEVRRARRLPEREVFPDDDGPSAIESPEPAPLDKAVVQERVLAYRVALTRLSQPERDAVILRLEQGERYDKIAAVLGLPSKDAARMMVNRSIARIADTVDPPAQPE